MDKEIKVKFTHLGTAMVLLEIGSIRILTGEVISYSDYLDPVFDRKDSYFYFGIGIGGTTKLQDPVFSPEELGKIDAVLLSHDEHAGSFS